MEKFANYSEQEHSEPSANQDPFPSPTRRRIHNTKRFSEDQVKSLESVFHRGAKIEQRNKLHLAKDLGLHPRQVSIWFQNKRARWKSKKIEQEYAALKANFDALHQQFQSLKKENDYLVEQLGRLNSTLESPQRTQSSTRDPNEDAKTASASANRETNSEGRESPERATHLEVDMEGINQCFREQEEPECINFSVSDQEDSWKASRQEWCNSVQDGVLDEPFGPWSWLPDF